MTVNIKCRSHQAGRAIVAGNGRRARAHVQELVSDQRQFGRMPMFSKLKAALARLAGRQGEGPAEPPIEYKGYRIRPTPYRNNSLYQTAGIIEKDTPEGVKEHRFIRADTHQGRDDAIAFAVSKAKQIIDLQGDRIFAQSNGG